MRETTEEEVRTGPGGRTAFGKRCAKLGIPIIPLGLPQAKGRIERNHGVHQDRLIKKLRLQPRASWEEANRSRREAYLPEPHRRLARRAASPVDFHTPVHEGVDRRQVFCLEEKRTSHPDGMVRYQNPRLQLQPPSHLSAPARSPVSVGEALDGSLRIVYRGQEAAGQPIRERPAREAEPMPEEKPRERWVPQSDHPWRRAWARRQRAMDRAGSPAGTGARFLGLRSFVRSAHFGTQPRKGKTGRFY